MRSNRKRGTGAATAGNSPEINNSLRPIDPDALLAALVEQDRAVTERLIASIAAEDAAVDRLLAELARDRGPDIDALLAADAAAFADLLDSVARDTGPDIAAMLDADRDRFAALVASIAARDQAPDRP